MKIISNIILSLLIFGCANYSASETASLAIDNNSSNGKNIENSKLNVFVKDGEVWIKDSTNVIQLTKTGNKIDEIYISPSGRYAAAQKIINNIVVDLTPNGDTLSIPLYSTIIIDLNTKCIIDELKNPEEESTTFIRWQGDNMFRFGHSSGFDVYAFYEYDLITKKVRELKYDRESGEHK